MQFIKKHWLKILLLLIGIGLRLGLAGATVHPDLLSISAGNFLLGRKGIVNIYDYLAQAPANERVIEVYGRSFFTYPPVAYFTLGTFNFLLSPFFSPNLYTRLLGGVGAFSGLGFDRDLLILKLPYSVFDLLTAFLLFKVFEKNRKTAWLAFFLWLFNPLSWYTSFMIGQFDIIPTFLIVLSAYLVLKKRFVWAAFCLGLGGSLKIFPLLLLPVLILVLGRNFWEKIKISIAGVLPYTLVIAPFLALPAFRQTVIFSDQSQKILFAKLPVSGAEGISFFVFGLVLVYLYVAWQGKSEKVWQYYLWILLLLFGVTHFHPQWFLWATPFLIWSAIDSNFKLFWQAMVLFGCWLVITLLFEPSLSLGLFVPVVPQAASIDLVKLVSEGLDVFQIKSLFRSIFAATALWWVLFP